MFMFPDQAIFISRTYIIRGVGGGMVGFTRGAVTE
jgi:hypothetical protein